MKKEDAMNINPESIRDMILRNSTSLEEVKKLNSPEELKVFNKNDSSK
jgi:hypothetical protein